MANADPTQHVLCAIQALVPPRPTMSGNRRLAQFATAALVSLLVVILAVCLLVALEAPRGLEIAVAIGWLAFVGIGAPISVVSGSRELTSRRQEMREWDNEPRRLLIERLGLELKSGRLPEGLSPEGLYALNDAAADWRQSREILGSLTWARGEIAEVRKSLGENLDEAMRNLLAEAAAGHPLGPAPFLMDRAKRLFAEVGAEATAMAAERSKGLALETDRSIEELRAGLDRLREVRSAGTAIPGEGTEVAATAGRPGE